MEKKAVSRIMLTLLLIGMFTLAFNTIPGQGLIPPVGLVSWWPGDGNALDIWDGNHGTLMNGATFDQGLVDQAFSLDGIDDYVDLGTGNNLNFGTNDFTIDLWVNFVTTDGEQVLIEKWVQKFWDGASSGWTLTKLANNVLRLALRDGYGPEVSFDVVPPSISTNTWFHVAVTRSGDIFTLYWNGTALGVIDCAYNLNSMSSLKMGHRGNPNDTPGSQDWRGFYLNGFIDEVEIFNRALSSQEIQAIYDSGSAGKVKKVMVSIDIDPDTLNLRSEGKWITAYIQLPEGYNAEDIDATTILLNGTIQPVLDPKYDFVTYSSEYLVDQNEDGILERMVKFDRAEVKAMVNVGNVTLTITGEVNGIPFEGSDTIRVID